MQYLSRKGKNDHQDDSEISRAVTPTMGLGSKAIFSSVSEGSAPCSVSVVKLVLPRASEAGPPSAVGMGLLPRAKEGAAATPVGSEGETFSLVNPKNRASSRRQLSASLEIKWNLPC